jgi:TolB-like protein/DNA-binding winged helix-turn-helix (wHTH) protein/tetratricopeptide (TPR) repeat protein
VQKAGTSVGNSLAWELQIGEWRVDSKGNELCRNKETVRLEPKAIEVLVYLARQAGKVVGREELLSAVWPGVIVGDDALTQAIIKLRRALGDDARLPKYIETVSKRGYRLIAPVTTATAATATAPADPAVVPDLPTGTRRSGSRGQWVLGAASFAILLVALTVVAWLGKTSGERRPAATVDSWPVIAVLPLASLSGDPNRDYVADGLTEDIINALGLFSGLRVISKNSADSFKTRPATPEAMKSELRARYVVKGSVREAEGKLRVAVELSDVEKTIVLWSDRQEGAATDVFAFQDRIVKNIVGALAVKITHIEEARAAAKHPDSVEAYDLVLRARALGVQSNRVANRQARALLAKAVELAPNYAESYVLLGMAEIQRVDFGWTEDPDQNIQRAVQYAERALAMDDVGASARAYGLLGVAYATTGTFDRALEAADRAIELNPSDAFAYNTRGVTLLWLGRTEDAIAAMETARRFDPVGRGAGSAFARVLAYYTAGRYRESLAAADADLVRYPEAAFLHAIRAATLARIGEVAAAHAEAEHVTQLDPFFRSADFGTRFVDPRQTARLREGLRMAGL